MTYLLGFCLLVFVITLLSLNPRPFPNIINRPGIDKIEHGLAYLSLGFFLFPLFQWSRRGWKKGFFSVLIFSIVYGGGIELIQRSFGRNPELADLIADILGGAAGAGLFLLFRKIIDIPED